MGYEFGYWLQNLVLLGCLVMAWRSRLALGPLTRGTILLIGLLIVRRLDDAYGILTPAQTFLLSSAVVTVFAFDLFQIYRQRESYALYRRNREERRAELDELYQRHSGFSDTPPAAGKKLQHALLHCRRALRRM